MAHSTWVILSSLLLLVPVKCGGTHYLLYSVNPGEGFNLRRDVYMRAAALVNELRGKEDWVLVLPPWPRLPHWRGDYREDNLKWEKFFDLSSLNEYVPVIEFDDYLEKEGRSINEVRTANEIYHANSLYTYSMYTHIANYYVIKNLFSM